MSGATPTAPTAGHWAYLRALNEQQVQALGVRRRRAQGNVLRAQARAAAYPGNPDAQGALAGAERDFDRQHHAYTSAYAHLLAGDDRVQAQAAQAEKARIRAGAQAHLQQQQRRRRFITGLRSLLPTSVRGGAEDASNFLVSLPTPGGLWPIVSLIVLFNLAIVPVGQRGETRLRLLWQALIGASALPTTVGDAALAAQYAQAAAAAEGQAASAAVQTIAGVYIPPAAAAAGANTALGAALSTATLGAVQPGDVTSYLRGLVGYPG